MRTTRTNKVAAGSGLKSTPFFEWKILMAKAHMEDGGSRKVHTTVQSPNSVLN